MPRADPQHLLLTKCVFAVLMVTTVIVAIEAGSAVLLRVERGAWSTLDTLAAERSSLVDSNHLSNLELGRLRQSQTLHPYAGFIYDPSAERVPPSRRQPAFEDRLIFEPSEQRVVIGVLGGSVADIVATGGSGLAVELRKIDRFEGREIEVVSLAFGGFKQPQQLTSLAYYLALGAHFDVIVNIDGFNEVALPEAELISRRVFPFYPRGWDQRVAPITSDAREVAVNVKRVMDRRSNLARYFSVWPLRSSHAAGVLWQALDRWSIRQQAELESRLLDDPSAEPTYGSHGPGRSYDSEAELYRDLARVWFRSSLQIAALCQSQGIEYYHFLQPNQYLEGSKPIAAERRRGMWKADHLYRPGVVKGYPELIDLGLELVERGVQFVDLTAIFDTRTELLYSDACCHFNFLGNTLLERAVAHHLAGNEFGRTENVSDGNLALEGFDPVSYFDQNPTRGQPELMVSHDGIGYRFVNESNRARFLADPRRFIPQFGGWCAFGLGMDEERMSVAPERYPVDPEQFEIVDDKLYLFYRSSLLDGRELWRTNPEYFMSRAAARWSELSQP